MMWMSLLTLCYNQKNLLAKQICTFLFKVFQWSAQNFSHLMAIEYGNDHILCRLCEQGREKSVTKGMEYARLVGGWGKLSKNVQKMNLLWLMSPISTYLLTDCTPLNNRHLLSCIVVNLFTPILWILIAHTYSLLTVCSFSNLQLLEKVVSGWLTNVCSTQRHIPASAK